jgi:hypothetical protein
MPLLVPLPLGATPPAGPPAGATPRPHAATPRPLLVPLPPDPILPEAA